MLTVLSPFVLVPASLSPLSFPVLFSLFPLVSVSALHLSASSLPLLISVSLPSPSTVLVSISLFLDVVFLALLSTKLEISVK